jgi:hypothetical protein
VQIQPLIKFLLNKEQINMADIVVRKPRKPVIKKEIEPMIDLAKEPTPVSPAVKEDFMTSKWRPMMAISYMAICLFDFMVGPILYNVLQYMNPGQHLEMWQAVTLQGGGLYHLSMGAIIGITAFGRTKEKMAEAKE